MKKDYIKPEIKVVDIRCQKILTTSSMDLLDEWTTVQW